MNKREAEIGELKIRLKEVERLTAQKVYKDIIDCGISVQNILSGRLDIKLKELKKRYDIK